MGSTARSATHPVGSEQDFSFFEALNFEPQKGPFRLSEAEIATTEATPPSPKPAQTRPPGPTYKLLPSAPHPPPQGPLPPLPTEQPKTPTQPEFPKSEKGAKSPQSNHSANGREERQGPQRTPTSVKPKTNRKRSDTVMSKSQQRGHDKCTELCHQVTVSGDRISVHLLDLLTTVNTVSPALDHLAHVFLDTCQILFVLDAGLSESGKTAPALPTDVLAELEKKFSITKSDFQMLDAMCLRLLDYERKGSMGKMRKGFGKMFGDTTPEKVTAALERTKSSLKMGSLVFQYTMADDKIHENKGIGFTGLAAALDRLDDKAGRPKPVETELQAHAMRSQTTLQTHASTQPPPSMPATWANDSISHVSTPQWGERTSSKHESSSTGMSSLLSPGHDVPRQYSVASASVSSVGSNERHHGYVDKLSVIDDAASYIGSAMADNETLLEELTSLDLSHEKAVRVRIDPNSMPRWQARGAPGSDTTSMKSELVSAIKHKNHSIVEQMLDRGVSPNTGLEHPALIEAIRVGDPESIRLLMLFGANANDADRDGITPLYAATQKGLLPGAVTLLKYGADPNILNGVDFETPLAAAAIAGRVSLTHLLLIYGADCNQVLSDGSTLLTASINKQTPKKLVDILLEYGAEPDNKNRMGQTPLFKAVEAQRVDIMESLLKAGANANLPGPKHLLWPSTYSTPCLEMLLSHGADHRKTPGVMELAASINNIDSIRVLLKAGVSPNIKKDSVYTPLCTAIRDNRPDILELLIKNGADPNLPASEYPAFKCITHKRQHFLPALLAAGSDLASPKGIVEQAVASNNMEALRWLLDQGLDPDVRNAKGASALTTAIRDNRVEMIDVLLNGGADPNKRGQDWPVCMAVKNPAILRRVLSVLAEPRAFKGVMEMAVSANQLESVKLLLDAGVSVEDRNGGVFSPLTTAIREDHRDIVHFLINEAGADVNAPGEHLPLIKALRRLQGEDTSIIQLLLRKGADPNLVYRGWNAVIQAIQNGDLDVLNLVCGTGAGVDLSVKDDLGRTVIEMAESRGWDEGVAVLKAAGR